MNHQTNEQTKTYEIQMKCWDYLPGWDHLPSRDKGPYVDKVYTTYGSHEKAMIALLSCAIEEADGLNFAPMDGDEELSLPVRGCFRIDLDSDYDAIIRFWYPNGDYECVTAYNVICADDEVEMYNQKLQSELGSDIGIEIKFECIDDIGVRYYYSVEHPEYCPTMFYTAEEAYIAAKTYFATIGLTKEEN